MKVNLGLGRKTAKQFWQAGLIVAAVIKKIDEIKWKPGLKGWINQYRPGCSLSTAEDAFLVAQWIPGDEIDTCTGIRPAVKAAQENKAREARRRSMHAEHERKREAQAKRKATIVANTRAKCEKVKVEREAVEAAKTQKDKEREAAEQVRKERYRQGDDLESTVEYILGEIDLMVGINLDDCMLRPGNNVFKLLSHSIRLPMAFDLKIINHFVDGAITERKHQNQKPML